MRSYAILWAWITRPKTWTNEQRPSPCMRNDIRWGHKLLVFAVESSFRTSGRTSSKSSADPAPCCEWISGKSFSVFQWSHVLIICYDSCAFRPCFPTCYLWNRFGRLCVRIYNSGSATVPPSHCPIVKRNSKRRQYVEAGPVFKDTSCDPYKHNQMHRLVHVGPWVSFSCFAVVECVGRRFYWFESRYRNKVPWVFQFQATSRHFQHVKAENCWRRPLLAQSDVRSAVHGSWARPDQQNFGFGLQMFAVCLLGLWWFCGSRVSSSDACKQAPLDSENRCHGLTENRWSWFMMVWYGLLWVCSFAFLSRHCHDEWKHLVFALSCINLDTLFWPPFWPPGHRSRSSRCSLQGFRLCVRHAYCCRCRVSCGGTPFFKLAMF